MKILLETVSAEARVLAEPAPLIDVTNLGDSSVDILVRVWCNAPDFFPTKLALGRQMKQALDAAGISWDGATVPLAGPFRSAENGRVFFAGDALPGRPLLSPVATLEGKLAGRHIVHGEETEPRYDAIPSAIYTVPTLASVGLTERAAADRGLDVGVKVSDMRSWRSASTESICERRWVSETSEGGTARGVSW